MPPPGSPKASNPKIPNFIQLNQEISNRLRRRGSASPSNPRLSLPHSQSLSHPRISHSHRHRSTIGNRATTTSAPLSFPASLSLSSVDCRTARRGICCDQGLHLLNAMSSSSLRLSRLIPSDERRFWGGILLSIGSVFFVGFFFAAVVSKLLPPSNVTIIAAVQNDWYYCFLVPLTLPIVMVAIYFHWLSMKMFKHA